MEVTKRNFDGTIKTPFQACKNCEAAIAAEKRRLKLCIKR